MSLTPTPHGDNPNDLSHQITQLFVGKCHATFYFILLTMK
jgi:hypothetical protein